MKLYIMLFAVFFMAACGSKEEPQTEMQTEPLEEEIVEAPIENELPLDEQIALKIEDELMSGKKTNTIILGHVFGMTKKEVYKHSLKLRKKKKIYGVKKYDKSGRNLREFVYDMQLREIGKCRTYFELFYHKNRMYHMECVPKIPKGRTPQEVVAEIVDLYSTKYGTSDFMVPAKSDEHSDEYLWFDNNLKIQVFSNKDRVVINYIDMPVAEQAKGQLDI